MTATSFTYVSVKFPDAYVGVPYEAAIGIKSGTSAVSAGAVSTGALPVGIVVNATDHVRLTGTPTTANVPGTYTFTLTLTDTTGTTVSGTYTIALHEASQVPDHATERPDEDVEAADLDAEWPVVQ